MLLKTNLHFHTSDDPHHSNIKYSTFEGIDKASKFGFDVLALTCHTEYVLTDEHIKYAEEKGILLLPGIEINIGENENDGRHLLIINCDKSAENIKTFKDLEIYKKENPHIFVIAPHPFFPSFSKQESLMEYTKKYSHLFDAVEHSWFYSNLINRNLPSQKFAEENNLPFVATSDTHFFNFLNTDYCNIEAEEKTPKSIFNAIQKGSFENVTRPKKLIKEMFFIYGTFSLKERPKT